MGVELKVPEVGESITEVEVGRWLKAEGDSVRKDEPVVEIETDKVTVEVPAPADGTVSQSLKKQGDQASVGEVIGYLEEGKVAAGGGGGGGQAPAVEDEEPESGPRRETEEQAAERTTGGSEGPAKPEGGDGQPRVMPAAQRLLEEHGLQPDQVEASGPGGRLLKEDVQRHVDQQTQQAKAPAKEEPAGTEAPAKEAAAAPAAAAQGDREEEVVPMSPMRRRIAERLVEAQQNAAMLTTFNEIDMSAVMDLRSRYKDDFDKQYGIKLGFMSFFVKAAVDALKQYPAINAEIRDRNIVYKNYYDVGIAIGSGKGLVVPILRSAERMSFAQIELKIADYANQVKENRLKLEDLQGGTFTITNGGVFGSMLSTPILNPPQSGVLGMHAIEKRPKVVGDEIKIRPMMYVALTYDHRIVDGREAVTFLRRLKETIEEPSRMLMEI